MGGPLVHPTVDTAGQRAGVGRAPAALGALLMVVLVMAGCRGGARPAGNGPTSPESTPGGEWIEAPPAEAATAPTGPVPVPLPGSPTTDYLAEVTDRILPPGTDAMAMLAAGRCGPLLREVAVTWSDVAPPLTLLYRGAAYACLSRWAEAQADHRRIDLSKICPAGDPGDGRRRSPLEGREDCLGVRMQVYKWTYALLIARQADPTFVPRFPTPPVP